MTDTDEDVDDFFEDLDRAMADVSAMSLAFAEDSSVDRSTDLRVEAELEAMKAALKARVN